MPKSGPQPDSACQTETPEPTILFVDESPIERDQFVALLTELNNQWRLLTATNAGACVAEIASSLQ